MMMMMMMTVMMALMMMLMKMMGCSPFRVSVGGSRYLMSHLRPYRPCCWSKILLLISMGRMMLDTCCVGCWDHMEADGDDGSNVDDAHICDTEDDGDKDNNWQRYVSDWFMHIYQLMMVISIVELIERQESQDLTSWHLEEFDSIHCNQAPRMWRGRGILNLFMWHLRFSVRIRIWFIFLWLQL